jgi:hypothetical protein
MSKKIFKKYIKQPFLKTSWQVDEMLKDSINPDIWENNMQFAIRGLRRDSISLSYEDEKIVKLASPTAAKVFESLRTPIDYPQALTDPNMLWFIAAYPDVIDYYYPTVNYYPFDKKAVEAQQKAIREIQTAREDEAFEIINKYFPDAENDPSIDFNKVYLKLKDEYKSKHGLELEA